MQRAIFWRLSVAVVVVFGMRADHPVAAQQILDPAPVDDDEGVEMELPLPGQTVDALKPARDMSHAFLGVTFDPRVRDAAVAWSVSAGSPADQAGMRAGDTIVALNGKSTGTYDDVLKTVAALKPGDVLTLRFRAA